jgi:hypothetical protein
MTLTPISVRSMGSAAEVKIGVGRIIAENDVVESYPIFIRPCLAGVWQTMKRET